MSKVETAIGRVWPPNRWADVTVLVGVSGGADSVALLSALAKARPEGSTGKIIVGHMNHGWRGRESDEDEAFVRSLADQYRLQSIVERGDSGKKTEESARRARIEFFCATSHRVGARYVALAHTLNDQVETILFRILRGTGIQGLRGIPFARQLTTGVSLIRPLLRVRRVEVEKYLSEIGQSFRTDRTNLDLSHTRNRIRRELLPMLVREYSRKIYASLTTLGDIAQDYHELITEITSARIREFIEIDKNEIRIRRARDFSLLPRMERLETLRALWTIMDWPKQPMSRSIWVRLDRAITQRMRSQFVFPGNVRVIGNDECVKLVRECRSGRFTTFVLRSNKP